MLHKTDQELLNERFIYAFRLLEQRGDIVRSDRKKGLSVFAEKVLGNRQYGHLVGDYLGGERLFPFKYVKKFCQTYNISEDFILHNRGEALQQGEYFLENEQEAEIVIKQSNILFSNIRAFASSTVDMQVYEESERFHIPGMHGEHVAFRVEGNSMMPTIAKGDMVICRVLDGIGSVRDNDIYAVAANGAVMIKRVQRIWDKTRSNVIKLKLISDNYLEHDPIIVPISQVFRVMRVEKKITDISF